ncbi:hypothetical protein SAMN04244553_1365 [Nocardia amikacinitolerans]|uniref:Uncharacterized protein n=2 Tax=Nocardia amikacinitolerans TaxID=756689 RepID=A0A285L1B0_9NOCA|nr:hypothetical protein SAMN04244553_1365 [Nocardia amikacinitolerans]
MSTLKSGGGPDGAGIKTGSAVRIGPMDPLAEADVAAGGRAVRGSAQDMYFFTSIEDFPPGIGDLSLTHDDTGGFYNYVKQFNTPNGWYRDGSVGQWIYQETFDNYLDDYGFDSARVVYHSGHGDMSAAGVFSIPVGNDWGGDHWTSSNDMRLGNEYARYVFWSTCLSLRVKGGHTPIRTWAAANLGLRMIFGYETVSVDDGRYGRLFFEEWNKNKSLSSAFLDASWRISSRQEPSVVACGATQSEASGRAFNERFFEGTPANTSWWWWRWYDAARMRSPNLRLPARLVSARLAPPLESIRGLADRFGLSLPGDAGAGDLQRGASFEGSSNLRLAIGPDGSREIALAETSDSPQQLAAAEAVRVARGAVEEYGLADEIDLILDHTRFDRQAGGSADDLIDESVRETTVVFTQVIDSLPVVTPGSGFLQVRVDNEGTVTGIADTTLRVADLRDHPPSPPDPNARRRDSSPRENTGDPSGGAEVTGRDGTIVDELLVGALQHRLRRVAASGRVPQDVRVVPNSSEIGYALRDGDAVVVARQEVEVDFGQGLAKRYVVEAPVLA